MKQWSILKTSIKFYLQYIMKDITHLLFQCFHHSAGIGSEINAFGVISNLETNEKIGFGTPELVPVLAIVDPELMKTILAKYTAYQGFDALFHNTEVMISNGVNIMSETLLPCP